MKRQTHWLVFVAVLSLLISPSLAATPTVTVYFDEDLTMRSIDLDEPGTVTLYVVAEGFDARLTAIEYKIDFPAGLTWVSDIDVTPIKIGTTAMGITQAWQDPLNASNRVVVGKALAKWDPAAGSAGEVVVSAHPVFGSVRATVAPDHRIVQAQGEISHGRPAKGASASSSVPVLYGAQPNPFNPSTQISFWVPRSEHVRITVYDVSGRRVAELLNEVRGRGQHSVEWSAGNMPSGVYFFRMEVGDFSEQRKVMLLK